MFPPPEDLPSTTDMEMRKKDSVELIREAMPILTGLAQVYTLRIPSEPVDIPYLNETTLHDVYFCHSSLRPSALVIHDLPVSTGCLHVITVYANQMLFPIEYASILETRIPRPVYLSNNGWRSASGGRREDEFSRYLDAHLRRRSRFLLDSLFPYYGASAFQRRARITFNWFSQLVPLNERQTLYLTHFHYMRGFFRSGGENKFNVNRALTDQSTVLAALQAYAYQGPVESTFALQPAVSPIAVPELTPRQHLPLVRDAWVVEAASRPDR